MDNPNNLRSTYNKSNRNPSPYYHQDEEEEEDVEEEEEDGYEGNELLEDEEEEEVERVNNDEFDDDNDEEEDEEEEDEEREQHDGVENGYDDDEEQGRRQQKKRRIESLVSNYEFAPRKQQQQQPLNPPPSEWTDHSTFLLLEAWGDRFMQLGRRSLRAEDWGEVAKKVSKGSKTNWDDSQCRNRLDYLKKKYRKERERMEGMGVKGYSGKWGFFKKMDMLLNLSSAREQQCGLPCGIDSGEYVFMSPRVYLERSNGLDEVRDSPEGSEEDDDDEGMGRRDGGSASFGLLADSVKKFGEIYEKIESGKREQMVELEKMRVDFQRELEVQKKQILERAQAEIAKIRGGDDGHGDEDEDEDETDFSAENFSG